MMKLDLAGYNVQSLNFNDLFNFFQVHFNEESPLSDQPNANFGDKEKSETIKHFI